MAPGPVATDFGGGFMKSDEFRAGAGTHIALGRVGEPEDVGVAIAALVVSDAGRWITAQRIEASGGTML